MDHGSCCAQSAKPCGAMQSECGLLLIVPRGADKRNIMPKKAMNDLHPPLPPLPLPLLPRPLPQPFHPPEARFWPPPNGGQHRVCRPVVVEQQGHPIRKGRPRVPDAELSSRAVDSGGIISCSGHTTSTCPTAAYGQVTACLDSSNGPRGPCIPDGAPFGLLALW